MYYTDNRCYIFVPGDTRFHTYVVYNTCVVVMYPVPSTISSFLRVTGKIRYYLHVYTCEGHHQSSIFYYTEVFPY